MDRAGWTLEQQDAFDALAEDGTTFTFTREVKGPLDPVRGAYGPGETLTFTAPGIVKLLTPSNYRVAQAWQDQALIKNGDEMLLTGCGTYDPKLEDRVDINGEAWIVKGMSTLRPGGVPLLQYLLIRRV